MAPDVRVIHRAPNRQRTMHQEVGGGGELNLREWLLQASAGALQITDLVPWQGDGGPSALLARHDVKVYFCDPQQPWQRGSNENTNGLLRQYFPKGMDLSDINQNRLNGVARRLNERPRETLNFETPAERFSQCVASIG